MIFMRLRGAWEPFLFCESLRQDRPRCIVLERKEKTENQQMPLMLFVWLRSFRLSKGFLTELSAMLMHSNTPMDRREVGTLANKRKRCFGRCVHISFLCAHFISAAVTSFHFPPCLFVFCFVLFTLCVICASLPIFLL